VPNGSSPAPIHRAALRVAARTSCCRQSLRPRSHPADTLSTSHGLAPERRAATFGDADFRYAGYFRYTGTRLSRSLAHFP
jgi:hypothetical protein